MNTIAGISSSSGRVARTRNFVLGPSDNSEEAWRALDEQVRICPTYTSPDSIQRER